MSKLISLTLLLLSLIGCAGRYNQRMTLMMEPFIGKPITQVTEAWGPPTTVYDESPYKIYVWHSSRTNGGGSHPQTQYNQQTRAWEKTQVSTPVHTSNTYRMFWVGSDGTCAKYKFGSQ
jgi:hypothetical protein